MEPIQPKFAKGGRGGSNLRDKSATMINFHHNFKVNLPITSLKNVDDSLLQPSKATNFSTNVSEGNTHRLPRITGKGKVNHLRINSLGSENPNPQGRVTNTSYNTSPFRSTRHVRTSVSPYRHGLSKNKLKDQRMNLSNYGRAFDPINVQDSKTPTFFEINESFEKQTTSDRGLKMNPKIIECWINETLADAEHLDIPGVLLKPEHKKPISRYGVDKLTLTNAGIPTEIVDRVYRALFVYSIGFFELMNKCLAHTKGKYKTITSIWKVYSVLLEYC